MIWCCLKIKENCHVLVNQFHGNFRFKTLGCRKIKSVFRDVKWCFNASGGLKGTHPYRCRVHKQTCVFIVLTPRCYCTFHVTLTLKLLLSSKCDTLTHSCFNVGPATQTLPQHWATTSDLLGTILLQRVSVCMNLFTYFDNPIFISQIKFLNVKGTCPGLNHQKINYFILA